MSSSEQPDPQRSQPAPGATGEISEEMREHLRARRAVDAEILAALS